LTNLKTTGASSAGASTTAGAGASSTAGAGASAAGAGAGAAGAGVGAAGVSTLAASSFFPQETNKAPTRRMIKAIDRTFFIYISPYEIYAFTIEYSKES
jgi:hypothetical protein